MVAIASISGVAIQQILGCIVDILKVQFAVEDFEAVAGLPQSVFITEGFACLNDIVFSGILFCMIPTIFLVPRLYGKIEPLLGAKPRTEDTILRGEGILSFKVVALSILAFLIAISGEFLSEQGISLIEWEAEWAESMPALIIAMVVAGIIALIIVGMIRNRKSSTVEGWK